MLSGQFDWGDLLLKGNNFIVALPAGDGGASIRPYAGTSEDPALPPAQASGHNATGADNQQERPGTHRTSGRDPGILRDCTPNVSDFQ